MRRFLLIVLLLTCAVALVACQRDAPMRPTLSSFEEAAGVSPLPTATPSATPTSTQTNTPTHTPTATVTPTPTITPVPSQRLGTAREAFFQGQYDLASQEYAALANDPGTEASERPLAAYWLGRSLLENGDYAAASTALLHFIQTYPDHPQVAAAHFLKARAYEGLGQWRDAMQAYRQYLALDDTLALYAYQKIAQAAMLILDYDQAVQAYHQGLQATPDNSWAVLMREGIAQAELARGDVDAALAQYDDILSVARIRAYRSKILYLAGEAYRHAENLEAAYEKYSEAVDLYPETYYAYLSLVELINAQVPVDDYLRGLTDYYAEAYQPAVDALTRVVETEPGRAGGNALWYLALSLKANGNLTQSIERFRQFIQDFPEHEQRDQAWLDMAEAYAWRGDLDLAIETYYQLVATHPQSLLAPTALWDAARLQANNDNWLAAATIYRDLAARYPDDEGTPEALFDAALFDYIRGDFEAARAGWQGLVDLYPDSQAAVGGRLWLGKALLVLGNQEEADTALQATVRWAPYSYYGLRAGDLLDGSGSPTNASSLGPLVVPDGTQAEAEAWLRSWLPVEDTASSLANLSPEIAQDPAWLRSKALLDVGLRKEALAELENFKEAWWDDPLKMYQLSLAFRELGAYRLSLVCAERLTWTSPIESRDEVPTFIQQLSYPLYYQDLIVPEAEKMEMDPLLLFTLIRQESLFEPSGTSVADARGLAQVIPPTGEWIATRLGWTDWEEDDLYLPYVSIPFGAWYLSVQLDTFDGEILPALAAYNAGPGNIHKWLDIAPDIDLFVETMTYSEPRRYVRTIYEDYHNYQNLYRPEP